MLRTYDVPPAFRAGIIVSRLCRLRRQWPADRCVGQGTGLHARRIGNPEAVAAKVREIEIRTATMLAMATEATRRQMAADIQAIEMTNDQARNDNASIIPVLESAAGAPASLGDDEDAWRGWWFDKLGYSYQASPKPTFAQDVVAQYQAPLHPDLLRRRHAGPHPRRRPPDRSDPGRRSGLQPGCRHRGPELPARRLRPPQPARQDLADQALRRRLRRVQHLSPVLASQSRLGPGPRAQSGRYPSPPSPASSASTTSSTDTIQPLYNLDVATSGTFFVGQSKLLVHDNTLPDHRLMPFDALPLP